MIKAQQLGTITVKSDTGVYAIDVHINDGGGFWAKVGDEELAADSLDKLRVLARDTFNSTRIKIPFVSPLGRKGILRGINAHTKDVLVTWADDDTKGKVDSHQDVYPADAITDEQIEEIKSLLSERDRINRRLNELAEGRVRASSLVNDAVGEELLPDYNWKRAQEEKAQVERPV